VFGVVRGVELVSGVGLGRQPADQSANDGVAELYRVHRVPMLRLACFLVSDRGLAEDVVQDAFVGLHRRWVQVEAGSAVAYLRMSVVNGARNVFRQRDVARRHLRGPDPDQGPAADWLMLVAEEHREVVLALRRVPLRQREVLVLRYYSELSEAQIADALGISRGTVKSSAARGLATLERILSGDDVD
jgi:RNA polymerase sigma-70 factor (sigma-E family)